LACLTKLRASVDWPPRSDEAAKAELAVRVDELVHWPPQAVADGCLEYARKKKKWPSEAALVQCVEAADKDAERKAAPAGPENFLARCKRVHGQDALWYRARHDQIMVPFRHHCDGTLSDDELRLWLDHIAQGEEYRPSPSLDVPGPRARNEVILLLGHYAPEARDLAGDNWREVLAEGARLWTSVRPPGGIAANRAASGFAVEAWFRKAVGRLQPDLPLHPAYLTSAMREVYRQMTGEEPDYLHGEELAAAEHRLRTAFTANEATRATTGTGPRFPQGPWPAREPVT
jgi:hypothetical protein